MVRRLWNKIVLKSIECNMWYVMRFVQSSELSWPIAPIFCGITTVIKEATWATFPVWHHYGITWHSLVVSMLNSPGSYQNAVSLDQQQWSLDLWCQRGRSYYVFSHLINQVSLVVGKPGRIDPQIPPHLENNDLHSRLVVGQTSNYTEAFKWSDCQL